ncbi:MAG TPA: hypothetical protein PKG48_11165, partial [Bacteroidales bacterium]|nr:hypothetical protein [Bacteroidales bacterium]
EGPLHEAILPGDGYFESKYKAIRNFKSLILLLIHEASAAFGKNLVQEQEVLNNLADMIMEVYIAESLTLRVEKMESLRGQDPSGVYRAIVDSFIYDAADNIRKPATDGFMSLGSITREDTYRRWIETLAVVPGINIKEVRRKISDKLVADNQYKW